MLASASDQQLLHEGLEVSINTDLDAQLLELEKAYGFFKDAQYQIRQEALSRRQQDTDRKTRQAEQRTLRARVDNARLVLHDLYTDQVAGFAAMKEQVERAMTGEAICQVSKDPYHIEFVS